MLEDDEEDSKMNVTKQISKTTKTKLSNLIEKNKYDLREKNKKVKNDYSQYDDITIDITKDFDCMTIKEEVKVTGDESSLSFDSISIEIDIDTDNNNKKNKKEKRKENVFESKAARSFLLKVQEAMNSYELTIGDLQYLNEGSYINDQIINFLFDYIILEGNYKADKRKMDKLNVFNFTSLFYSSLVKLEIESNKSLYDNINDIKGNFSKNSSMKEKIQNEMFFTNIMKSYESKQIHNWKKNIDKFKYSTWVFPIIYESHWSLIIVINPNFIENCFVIDDKNSKLKSEEFYKEIEFKLNKKMEIDDFENIKSEPVDNKEYPTILYLDSLGKRNKLLVNLCIKYLFYEYFNKINHFNTLTPEIVRNNHEYILNIMFSKRNKINTIDLNVSFIDIRFQSKTIFMIVEYLFLNISDAM